MDKDSSKSSYKQNNLNASAPIPSVRRPMGVKINRILNNLEKSLLNRFNSNSNSAASSLSSKTLKNSASITISKPTANFDKNHSQQSTKQRCNEAKVQKELTSHNKHKIQLQDASSAEKGGKMTLNKYQQQIVSTMRSQQLLVNNKLSIPPPHANDEARNQSHQLLFGASSNAPQHDQSSDADSKTKHSHSSGIESHNRKDNIDEGFINESKNRNHEVSSMQNTSTHSINNLTPKLGSHCNTLGRNTKITPDEEEDSGFSTFQSRRSISALNLCPKVSIPTSSATTTLTTATISSEAPNAKLNNMILMPSSQIPFANPNYTHHQQQVFLNANIVPNPIIYNYQSQIRAPYSHQPQFIHTDHLVTSNQVPTFEVNNKTNINGYINNNNQSNLRYSQQYNDQASFQRQLVPLYNMFGQNIAFIPVTTIDNSQQIYVNAPPKPRRYQYYDSNSVMVQMPHLTNSTSPGFTQTSLTSTTNPLMRQQVRNNCSLPQISTSNYQGHLPFNPPQMQNLQQIKPHIFPDPSVYNVNAHSQAFVSHQYDIRASQNFNNNRFTPENNQSLHPAQCSNQPIRNFFPTLTKSKSSLEASDLDRFKLARSRNCIPLQQTVAVNQHQDQLPSYAPNQYNSNRYSTNLTPIQQLPSMGSNLHRSKSVTHLVPDDNNSLNQQHPKELLMDNQNLDATPLVNNGNKFLAVSSASTSNLNYMGLSDYNQQNQVHQFPRMPAQVSSSHQLQQYNQSAQHNRNQLFSTLGYTQQQHLQQQQQQQQQQQLQQQKLQQQTPQLSQLNHHQQPIQHQSTNDINSPSRPNFKGSSTALTNSNKPLPKQLGRTQQSYNKPNSNGLDDSKTTLDDKIRHLLISDNDNEAHPLSNRSFNILTNNTTNKQHTNTNNSVNPPGIWNINEKYDGSIASKSFTHQEQPSSGILKNNPTSGELTQNTRTYVNTSLLRMGNRQQRHYKLADLEVPDSSSSEAKFLVSGEQNLLRKNDSQLIVDLTTPRVLARTQTTLHNSIEQPNEVKSGESWQSKPVILSQTSSQLYENTSGIQSKLSVRLGQQLDEEQQNVDRGKQQESCKSSSSTTAENIDKKMSDLSTSCERIAPYYYSDLKSDEQRKALLNIVQQKSLSPPPQLLSRSTDQNNTRLGPKSATLHSIHAKMLSENLAEKRPFDSKIALSSSQDNYSSATNLTESADKLFTVSPNPLGSGGSNNGDADYSASSSASSSIGNELPVNLEEKSSSNLLGQDDEDFIEFLSSDSSTNQHKSHFDASQFSASDFNTSSNSESSTSGACTDSLSTPSLSTGSNKSKIRTVKQPGHPFKNGSTNTGILKSSKSEVNSKNGMEKNNNINRDNKNNAANISRRSVTGNTKNISSAMGGTNTTNVDSIDTSNVENEKSKFNNILGNVIDVDVCPMNNLSHCIPVSNQTSFTSS